MDCTNTNNGWFNLDDCQPENGQNVWFILDGAMIPGQFDQTMCAFKVTDGSLIPMSLVRQWTEIGEKEITKCPQEHEIVAAYIPDFEIPMIGSFKKHFVSEETGEDIQALIISDIYEMEEVCDCVIGIDWFHVFYWYHLPEAPKVILSNPVEQAKAELERGVDTEAPAEPETCFELVPAEENQIIDDEAVAVKEVPVTEGTSAIKAFKANN